MRNSSSLDWLRFMHTPNDYRVSRDLLVGGIIGGFGGWLFCTIAHKAAIYLEPSTRTKRKEIKQWSVTIYVGLLTILGIVLYSTIKSW